MAKCPKCKAGEWKALGGGEMQCYNCGYSVSVARMARMAPMPDPDTVGRMTREIEGLRGGMKITVFPDGTRKITRLSAEELDKIGIPEALKSGVIGYDGDQLPNPEQLNKILADAIAKNFDKTIMKHFDPKTGKLSDPVGVAREAIEGVDEDLQDYNEKFGEIHADPAPISKDREIAEAMKYATDFGASIKSETLERFMKEMFYNNKVMLKYAKEFQISVIPFVIELVSHANDAGRTAINMEYFFKLSKVDKVNVLAMLNSLAFAHVAQASGHEDWSNDIYRKSKSKTQTEYPHHGGEDKDDKDG